MNYQISTVSTADYSEMIEVWEASIRATHHFLTEEWITEHKPLILNQYFDMVDLSCVKDTKGAVIGFLGTAAGNIEMLFVHPDGFGKGIGRSLIQHAIQVQNATKVDVNEDNPGACRFYQKLGFEISGRSELDGQGNPYPLLHMTLKKP